ncbi:MAG: hypothetical protein HY274_08495 [Gammaproteobacteria bacterium]|nr:hypothetical protein [Gammaproteobacteria bacterium]
MKKSFSLYRFATALVLLLSPLVVTANESDWAKFLNSPTETTHKTLLQDLKKCKNVTRCKEAPSSEAVVKLVKLVETKNSYAVDVAFLSRHLHLLDGGNLEDVNRALGRLAESDPTLLLSHLKKYRVSGRSFDSTLVMLPLETVDDVGAKRRTMQKRIDSLSTVSDQSLARERDNAILVLKRKLAKLQSENKGTQPDK